jgi:hypothetical protein
LTTGRLEFSSLVSNCSAARVLPCCANFRKSKIKLASAFADAFLCARYNVLHGVARRARRPRHNQVSSCSALTPTDSAATALGIPVSINLQICSIYWSLGLERFIVVLRDPRTVSPP